MRLIQDAAEGSYGYLVFPRNNRSVNGIVARASELYMTSLLRDLSKTSRFKAPLHLTKRLRAKPPQLLPQSTGSWAVSSPEEVRSRDRAPRADCRVLRLPSRPGWLYQPPDTAQRTNRPLSKSLPQTGASCAYCRTSRPNRPLLCHRLRSPYTLESVAEFDLMRARTPTRFSK